MKTHIIHKLENNEQILKKSTKIIFDPKMKIASNKYHIKSFKIIVEGRRKKLKLLNSNKAIW